MAGAPFTDTTRSKRLTPHTCSRSPMTRQRRLTRSTQDSCCALSSPKMRANTSSCGGGGGTSGGGGRWRRRQEGGDGDCSVIGYFCCIAPLKVIPIENA